MPASTAHGQREYHRFGHPVVAPGAPFAAVTAAVVAIALALTLFRLGRVDVCGGNEAVEGVFVQQMVEHDNYLFPLENGRHPMYKPPLFHWTATALDRLLGFRKVTSFNLRLPSALYAVAGVLLTMLFARAILGTDAAIIAGLTLAASYQYVSQGRFGRVDMTLTFFETLALFSFLWWFGPEPESARAEEHPRRTGMQLLCAVSLGLAVLAKGPAGAIIPLGAIAIFVVSEGRLAEALGRLSLLSVLPGILIGSSWYVACYLGGRYQFLNRQLGSENFGRFFGSLGTMAPSYYVVPVLFNSAPLSLLVPVAVGAALLTGRADCAAEERALQAAGARRAVKLLAFFWIVTVVFFTVAAYKRRAYLLPLWPASAVMIAWLVTRASSRLSGRILELSYAALCLALIVFNFFFIPHRETRQCGGDSFRETAEEVRRIVGPEEPLYLYGFKEEIAPLLFYLDRDAPQLGGKLGDAPPGYVIAPAEVWRAKRSEALDFEPVMTSSHGTHKLVLLRRGKLYASRSEAIDCGLERQFPTLIRSAPEGRIHSD